MKVKKVLLVMISVFFCMSLHTQAQSNADILKWTLTKSWSQGFKALPEVCTNLQEFYDQYHKNKKQWDIMFKWLATQDLLNITAGRHKIPNSNLVASVEDSFNKPIEKHVAESHFHHIDFQYVVKGCERFGLADHDTSYPDRAYTPDFMGYTFDKDKTVFIDSTPNRFFLFFPSDWHIAKVETEQESQAIRVIVIKLDYIK